MNSKTLDRQEAPPENNLTDNFDIPEMNRRSFFKRTLLGGGAAIATGGIAVAASKASLDGVIDPVGIEVASNFKQMDQRNSLLTFSESSYLNDDLYPERNEQYSRLHKKDFHFKRAWSEFDRAVHNKDDRPGYTQLDRAINSAAPGPIRNTRGIVSMNGQPDSFFYSWDQSRKNAVQYKFSDGQDAKEKTFSAGRLLGASRIGIAKFDERFVFNPMYDYINDKELTWEDDFPFKPKSVIVIAVAEDYDSIATSPSMVASAATFCGYVDMAIVASRIASFVQNLGYHAVASGNDLGNSVAFGILAGLGEGGRNNQLIMPGIGPRARLAKIFTDIDFGDAYDQPRSWGIKEFCKSCMKCADACPSEAISREVEPSFEPKYEFSDEPGYTWNNHVGIKKWHGDAKKCFNFWRDNDASCTNCKAACTFNEPDVWHHWLIMAVNPMAPKFVHSLMADAHPAFGYGGQGPAPIAHKVENFWKSGKGMRTNIKSKDNQYTAGQA